MELVHRRCSNYIFILNLTHGFNRLGKDNCKTRGETFKFWDSVWLILEIWWYVHFICRVLQRTSISTNIKERLDFSCALFGPDGGLVANAPHIPVHLGAMQETVQYQVSTLKPIIKDAP